MEKINRALKLRLYPTPEQETFLSRSLGCARLFYNYLLGERIDFYKNEIEPVKDDPKLRKDKYRAFKATTKNQFKEKFEFAKECSDDCLNSTERNLQSAFSNFFKSVGGKRKGVTGFPKFRSKKEHRDSYTECHVKKNAFDFHNRKVSIAKCQPICFRHREKLPKWYSEKNCVLKSITVSRNPNGEYWASLLFELPCFYSSPRPADENQAVGLDWSPENFYIDSEGRSGKDYGYKPQEQEHLRQLRKLERRLARKAKDSMNREKARLKLARLEKHISDSRKWWAENEVLRLARSFSTVGVEDLNLRGISGFLRNARNVNDCGYAMFVEKLEQKGLELGSAIVKADRYFPSSQLRGVCGYRNRGLRLSDRTWVCPSCGARLFRDRNAAVNLRNEAIRVRMRRAELKSVEIVEGTRAFASQALGAGALGEAEKQCP